MRALRRCDFCAADPVGTFEVVPPELDPTEAEQRRAVLCADCKARLETLVEPLLARAGADTAIDSTAGDDAEGSGTVIASANESTEKRPRTTGSNATVSDPPAADRGDVDDGEETSDDRAETAGSDATVDPGAVDADADSGDDADGDAAAATRGITVEHADDDVDANDDVAPSETETDGSSAADAGDSNAIDASTARSNGTDGETGDGETGDTEVDDDGRVDDDGSDDAEGGDSDASVGAAASTTARRGPRAYAKVVRLLRNRRAPMDRRAIESLAASAYDLETQQVETIIDHAIENGEFVEEEGVLRPA